MPVNTDETGMLVVAARFLEKGTSARSAAANDVLRWDGRRSRLIGQVLCPCPRMVDIQERVQMIGDYRRGFDRSRLRAKVIYEVCRAIHLIHAGVVAYLTVSIVDQLGMNLKL